MKFKLPVETPALHVPSMPPFLREIWAHLYPTSPPPTYRVLASRPNETHSKFIATIYLCVKPVGRGHAYSLSFGIHHQVNRAIQEVVGDAIILLRTHDRDMRRCPRYAYLPRLD